MLISGCRADGNGAAFVLLPSNITVFTLDFSGSGLSDGDFVSLGWNEVSFPYCFSTVKHLNILLGYGYVSNNLAVLSRKKI